MDESDLYIVNLNGTGLRRLTYQAGPDVLPSISPDGRVLAYCHHGSLCARRVDRPSVNVLLAPAPGGDMLCFSPKFSPNGLRILYSMAIVFPPGKPVPKKRPENEIRLIKPDGTDQRTLTTGDAPQFGPDGKRIVFWIWNADAKRSEVRLINTDGRNLRTIGTGSTPILSPDGRTIAVTEYVAEKDIIEVRLMNTDGSNLRNLGQGVNPVFSPDGALLLFDREYEVAAGGTASPSPRARRLGGPWRFRSQSLVTYVLAGPDTGKRFEPKYEERGFAELDARFSPDGRKIVFVRQAEHKDDAGQGLWVMDFDRSHAQRVMNYSGIRFPSFTPDGRSIVCNWNGDLCLMNADGARRMLLTSGIGVEDYEFMPDGRRLLLKARSDGEPWWHVGTPVLLP